MKSDKESLRLADKIIDSLEKFFFYLPPHVDAELGSLAEDAEAYIKSRNKPLPESIQMHIKNRRES